jgi:hypothetical protein
MAGLRKRERVSCNTGAYPAERQTLERSCAVRFSIDGGSGSRFGFGLAQVEF